MSTEARTPPSLPSRDPAPDARREALADAQKDYAYDFSYAEQCFIAKLPLAQNFGPHYMLRAAAVQAELAANRAASSVSSWTAELGTFLGGETTEADPLEPWAKMFPTLKTPAAVAHWKEDWCFGWQRIA